MIDRKYSRFGVSACWIIFRLLGLSVDRIGKILLLEDNICFRYFSAGFMLIEIKLSRCFMLNRAYSY